MQGRAHLHPLPPAAHSVAEDEEEDEGHGGRNGQRHQEVEEVVWAPQRLRRGVVLSELGQDSCARIWAGNVHWNHFVDIDLEQKLSGKF